MKIVNTDNFGGDYPDERFLSTTDSDGRSRPMCVDKEHGEKLCTLLNRLEGGDDARRYWKLVPDDYVLSGPFVP